MQFDSIPSTNVMEGILLRFKMNIIAINYSIGEKNLKPQKHQIAILLKSIALEKR